LSEIQKWCIDNNLLHVSSWGAMPSLDRGNNLYLGSIGVYGSRYANRVLQNSDAILILGSRLDNRQRTGNPNAFAPFARKIVIDIDNEELKKFEKDPTYSGFCIDLSLAEDILPKIMNQHQHNVWVSEVLGERALVNEGFDWACKPENLNPYYSIREIQEKFEANSIAVSDCGANLCWVYQSYLPSKTFLFTAGGNSPMGYSLPAAIGAAIANPSKTIYAFIGDGGLQMNIQELQTVVSLQLNIKVIIQNNFGYGIIKQFQDAYFNSRYFATGEGYSQPNFESISKAYGMKHTILSSVYDIRNFKFIYGPEVLELIHDANTLITPKVEMDRFLHDQFPYINDEKISDMHFQYPKAPSHLTKSKS
jgi:acetolactate synthase-1/2/3 large subunit